MGLQSLGEYAGCLVEIVRPGVGESEVDRESFVRWGVLKESDG